jgi:hypothetical protein
MVQGSTNEGTVSYPAPKTSSRAQYRGTLKLHLRTAITASTIVFAASACPVHLAASTGRPAASARYRPAPPTSIRLCLVLPGPPASTCRRLARPPQAASAPEGIAATSPPRAGRPDIAGCPDIVGCLATAKVFFFT